jgi:hypothetical protein
MPLLPPAVVVTLGGAAQAGHAASLRVTARRIMAEAAVRTSPMFSLPELVGVGRRLVRGRTHGATRAVRVRAGRQSPGPDR